MTSSSLPVLGYQPGRGGQVLDLELLVGTRLLVQGVSGSGKSTAIRGLLEQTNGHVPHLVIDREGEFATLREKFPYVLAGREGDVPADVRTAKLLVRRIVELGTSLIVDLGDLRLPEQREWVRRAFEELVHLPRELWRPLLVALDEAQLFCPERGSGESVATQAVIDVATLGRKRGYCLIAATQRLSKLHKDCAAELLNKFIGYTDDVDLQRAGDQLGMTKEQRATLKVLEWGQFFVYGPAISKRPVLVRTPETKTQAPPRGQVRPPAPPAPAAIKKLLDQLQDLPKQADEEARSIADLERKNRELQGRIRQLERGAPKAPTAAPIVKVEEKRVDVPVLKDGQVTRFEKATERLAKFGEQLPAAIAAAVQPVVVVGQEITVALARFHQPGNGGEPRRAGVPSRAPVTPARRTLPAAPGTRQAPRQPDVPVGDGQISGVTQKILDALAELEALGSDEPEKELVAILAGYTNLASKGFANAIGAARSDGLITYPTGGKVALTDAGRALAAGVDAPRSSAEIQERIFGLLGGASEKILRPLVEAYPAAVDKTELAAAAGYGNLASKGFANAIGRLRSLGFIEYPQSGQVKARPVLFLEGR